MNSHKFNMYAGAVIGSLLVFLLLNFFTELIYTGGGHSEHEQLAFAVEIEGSAESAAGSEQQEAPDLAALVASADVTEGEKVFKQCKTCHKVEDGANATGPSLWGVVGRPIGTAPGFSYTEALAGHGGEWSLQNLVDFLSSPKDFAPGTKMSFKGLKKAEDAVNVIVYLNEADGSPMPLE